MKNTLLKEVSISVLIVSVGLIVLNYPDFNLTFGIFNTGNDTFLWPSIIGSVINLLLFFSITEYLIPQFLRKNGLLTFNLSLVITFIVLSGIEILIDCLIALYIYKYEHNIDLAEVILMVVFMHILVVIIAVAYRFSKDWFKNEKLNQQRKEAQLHSELNLLKAQINPHFLFNALNSLFSMSLKANDEKTAEGIGKLAEMMRYVFDKGQMERVSLREEIQYVQDYIYLQQLRFESHIKVNFNFELNEKYSDIPPMILMPFIENAFKYGVSSQTPSQIDIDLKIENNTLNFSVLNQSFEHTETIPSHGVGLANVKKRLELLFSDKYKLDIIPAKEQFKINLKIDLI